MNEEKTFEPIRIKIPLPQPIYIRPQAPPEKVYKLYESLFTERDVILTWLRDLGHTEFDHTSFLRFSEPRSERNSIQIAVTVRTRKESDGEPIYYWIVTLFHPEPHKVIPSIFRIVEGVLRYISKDAYIDTESEE